MDVARGNPTNNMQILKDALPEYLSKHYGERIKKQNSNRILMRCPFHEDKHPSFSANNSTGTWLYKCFACGTSGSIIDLHAQASGLVAKSRENILSAAESVGVALPDSREFTAKEKRNYAKLKRKQKAIEKRKLRRKKIDADITQQISNVLENKLAPYVDDCWRLELLDTSPIRFYEPNDTPKDLIQFLFNSDDVLWLGGQYDTGKPRHAANFKTCEDWIKCETLPTRLAAGTFKAGSISRCNDNVLTSPFIIIESDDLIGHKPTTPEGKERNKQLGAALIRYAQERLGLTLRAVIDTGNKSLHAWFDRPPESDLRAIKRMADGLRIDAGVIDNCQSSPLRMPHCIHEITKQMARLLYLNPVL